MPKNTALRAAALTAALFVGQICAAETKLINVPAGDLTAALETLARQSGVELVYRPEQLKGLQTKGVRGALSSEDAVRKLIEGTRLTLRTDPSGVLLISSADEPVKISETAANGSLHLVRSETASKRDLPEKSSSAAKRARGEGSAGAPVQEIIVTAQKRVERLQDVPVPVTALSAARLVNDNKLLLQDYFTQIPGLTLTLSGQSTQALSIRGITTGIANPSVGITVDDVPYGGSTAIGGGNQVPDIDPGDLTRVEVLRGPQGTLYGASSMGGLLKFVTADPLTEALNGRIQGGVSTVQGGSDFGYNVRGSINVPLGDTFAFLASGFTRRDPGYIDNIQSGKDDVNRTDVSGGRLSALWRPSDNLSLKMSAMAQESKGDGFTYVHAGLGDLEQSVLRGVGGYERKAQAYSANLTAKLGRVDLTSVTGYNINEIADSIDNTLFLGGLTESVFGVQGSPAFNTVRTSKFTQEVRLAAPLSERIEGLLGAFYTNDHSFFQQYYRAADQATGAIVGDEIRHSVPTTFKEQAAFASVTFHLTDRFDVQVGGRQSRIEYSTRSTDTGPFVPIFYPGASSPLSVPRTKADNDAFTYLLTPRLKISPDLMAYARMASGYRAGGINGLAAPQFQYLPDKTHNYEVGVKGDFLDQRLSLDASLYYIDWKDIQLNVIGPSGSYLVNGSRAKSQGLELSVESRPWSGLVLAAWIVLGEAELTENFPAGAATPRRAGDRLPFSSRVSGNFSVDQEFPLAGMTAFVGGALSYIGERAPAIGAPGPQLFPSYTRADLRAGVRHDSWTVNLFVNNVADERGILATGYPSGFVYIQPRTAGISVGKAF